MTNPPESRPPLAIASEWVARITAVSLEMVVPGLAGLWLDERWGTRFIGLLGFGLGVAVGIWHLLVLTRPALTGRNHDGRPNLGNESKGKDTKR